MAHILVVDDSPEATLLVGRLLENGGFTVESFSSGLDALAKMASASATGTGFPDLVLTDLIMPVMDGLEVVEQVRERFPRVPVILMTAYGSGDVAVQALKKGASSYIPKRRLVHNLVQTVEDVLSVARAERKHTALLGALVSSSYVFELGNDQTMISSVVRFLRDQLVARFETVDEAVLMQTGMAVQEALRNAMHHGNLEVSSELRQHSSREYDAQVEKRLGDTAFNKRHVRFELTISETAVRCVVRDDGPGFDWALVPDPTDPDNVMRSSGRGLFLISTFMDSVHHNEKGNEITMIKTVAPGAGTGA